jgi:hypothetical protein
MKVSRRAAFLGAVGAAVTRLRAGEPERKVGSYQYERWGVFWREPAVVGSDKYSPVESEAEAWRLAGALLQSEDASGVQVFAHPVGSGIPKWESHSWVWHDLGGNIGFWARTK